MIEIREFIPDDSDDLRIVNDQMDCFLRKIYRPTQAGYANRSRISRDLTRLVAVSDGKVVGTTQYYMESGCMRVLGLGVHDRYRLRGIARSLLNRVFDLAVERECTSVRLSTIKETGNVQIFERIGFEIVGEQEEIYCEGLNGEKVSDIEMEFRLTRQWGGRGGIRAF